MEHLAWEDIWSFCTCGCSYLCYEYIVSSIVVYGIADAGIRFRRS